MKFLLIRQQKGGCDYTIGCGISVNTMEASSIEDAIQKVVGLSDNWQQEILQGAKDTGYSVDDYIHDYVIDYKSGLMNVADSDIRSVMLYPIAEGAVDMMPILRQRFSELKAWQKELHQQDQEKAERAQYEKLRKKFER